MTPKLAIVQNYVGFAAVYPTFGAENWHTGC